jgi:hypothetical protein
VRCKRGTRIIPVFVQSNNKNGVATYSIEKGKAVTVCIILMTADIVIHGRNA